MGWSQIAGDIPGWIGCAASIVVGVVTYHQRQKNSELEEKINELRLKSYQRDEELRARAKIVIEVERGESQHSYRARVTNRGLADARDVHIEYSGDEDNSPLMKGDPGLIPMSRLCPGVSYTFHLGVHMRCVPPFLFRARWIDGDGSERQEHFELRW